jgi:hypothetical protein
MERHLYLPDPIPLLQQVDGHAHLHAEASCQGPGGPEGGSGQAPLAGERLGRFPARGALDPRPGQPNDQAVASPFGPLRRKRRDRHVGSAITHGVDQRPRSRGGVLEVAVEKQQSVQRIPSRPAPVDLVDCRSTAVHRRTLSLVPGMLDHHGAGLVCGCGGRVPRAVIDNHHQFDSRNRRRAPNRGGDSRLLVLRRDDHRDPQHAAEPTASATATASLGSVA